MKLINCIFENLWNKKKNNIFVRFLRKILNKYFEHANEDARGKLLKKLWKSDLGFNYLLDREVPDNIVDIFFNEIKKNNNINKDSICEIGAGNGYLLEVLSIRMPGYKFVGIDLNDKQINKNISKNENNKQLGFVCDDILHYVDSVGPMVFISYLSLTTLTYSVFEKLLSKIKKGSRLIFFEPFVGDKILAGESKTRGLAFFHDYEGLLLNHGFSIVKKDYFRSNNFIFIVSVKN